MSVSISITSLQSAGTAYVFSDPGSANGNTVNALEMVKTAQLMVDSAAAKFQAALETLNAALAELAALSPPKPGEDGKVDPAAQAAYDAAVNAAKAKIARANQDVYKANYEYRTSVEALDRANQMLPVAEQRDEQQRKAFEESKRQVAEAQKQIDEAMRRALESAKQVEQKQPDQYWAWDAIRNVARDVGQGDLRGADFLAGKKERQEQKTLEQGQALAAQQAASGVVFGGTATRDTFAGTTAKQTAATNTTKAAKTTATGLATPSKDKDDVDTRAKAVHVLLRNNMMSTAMAKTLDWPSLKGATNTAQLIALLSVNADKANASDRSVWRSAIHGLDGEYESVAGSTAA